MSSYIFGEVTLQDFTGSTATITASGLNVNVQNFPATQPVSATALPLPTGAATAALQTTINNKLVAGTVIGDVNAAQKGTWNIANVSGTVSLPTGASTEATLSSLNGKVTAVNTGAVTISTALPAGVNNIGSITNVTGTVSLPTGASTSANQTTTNTNLTNIYTRQSDKSQFTKLTDGTNNVAVEATNALKTTLPLGTKIELEYYANSKNTNANVWKASGLRYIIPAGYKFELTRFAHFGSNSNTYSRVSSNLLMGTFNTSTNVFTNGNSTSAPDFYNIVEAEVTTQLSANATTLTVTYVNQDEIGGRTGTISLPSAAPLNNRYAMTLQTGDIGVIDITNVTDSANPTGVVALYGTKQLCIGQFTANQYQTTTFTKQTVMCDAGEILSIDIGTTNNTSYTRRTSFMGNLIAY